MSEARKDQNDMPENVANNVESLKHRMRETANQARDFAGQARDAVDEKLRTVGQQVSQQAERLNESLHENVDRLRSMGSEDLERAWNGVKSKARENPAQTIMVAAAAGFMVGLLFHAATSNKS